MITLSTGGGGEMIRVFRFFWGGGGEGWGEEKWVEGVRAGKLGKFLEIALPKFHNVRGSIVGRQKTFHTIIMYHLAPVILTLFTWEKCPTFWIYILLRGPAS